MKGPLFAFALIALLSCLNTRMVSCASADDILHCHGVSILEPHSTPSGSDYSYLMNTTGASDATATQSQDVTFTSPTLVSSFTYGVINVTVYHTQITQVDSVQLHVAIGYYDESGNYHIHNVQISDYLPEGSTVTSYQVIDIMQLHAGQRLWVRVYLSSGLFIFWGDLAHDSQISYTGTGDYVPEFPSFLILSIFMTGTLLATSILRRRHTA